MLREVLCAHGKEQRTRPLMLCVEEGGAHLALGVLQGGLLAQLLRHALLPAHPAADPPPIALSARHAHWTTVSVGAYHFEGTGRSLLV